MRVKSRTSVQFNIVKLLTLVLVVMLAMLTPRWLSALAADLANVAAMPFWEQLAQKRSYKVVGDTLPAERWLDFALALNPDNSQAAGLLFQIYMLRDRQAEATNVLLSSTYLRSFEPMASSVVALSSDWSQPSVQSMRARTIKWPFTTSALAHYLWWLGLTEQRAGHWEQSIKYYQQGFAVSPYRPPESVQREYYLALAQSFRSAASRSNATHNHYIAGKFFQMAGSMTEAAAEAEALLAIRHGNSAQWRAWAYYVLGVRAEGKGEAAQALGYYGQAVIADNRFVYAIVALKQLADEQESAKLVAYTEKLLEEKQPEYAPRPPFQDDSPQIRLFENGWALLGYDLDEDILAAGLDVPMVLYWQSSHPVAVEASGWYSAGDRWLHITTQPSLVTNPGFEWQGDAVYARPIGYMCSAGQRGACGAVRDTIGARSGLVAVIGTRSPDNHAKLWSKPLPVRGGRMYLGASWMRVEGRETDRVFGLIGAWWLDDNGGIDQPLQWPIPWWVTVRSDIQGYGRWLYQGSVLRAPSNATRLVIGVLNNLKVEGQGSVYVDNFLFVPLDLPPVP